MSKYDFMELEDLAEAAGTRYLEKDYQGILSTLDEIVATAKRIKSDLEGK